MFKMQEYFLLCLPFCLTMGLSPADDKAMMNPFEDFGKNSYSKASTSRRSVNPLRCPFLAPGLMFK